MSIELKEVCVCLEERLKLNQPTERVHWTQVIKYVHDNYTPSEGYVLGKCADLYKVADNNNKKQCNVEWEYELIEVKPKKTVKKTTKVNKTVKKTTTNKSE